MFSEEYKNGFEDGVKSAWEVYSKYLKNFINGAVENQQHLTQIDFEKFISELSKDIKEQYFNPDVEEYIYIRYSDDAFKIFQK